MTPALKDSPRLPLLALCLLSLGAGVFQILCISLVRWIDPRVLRKKLGESTSP